MADAKISALTALTGANVASADDVLAIVDTSVTTTKKITIDEFDTALWNKTAHTIGSNYTATRAAGTVASGATTAISHQTTLVGDAGGTTNYTNYEIKSTTSGANAITQLLTKYVQTIHGGSATLTTSYGVLGETTLSSTGNVTTTRPIAGKLTLSSSGSVTNGDIFVALAPTLSSTGAITTHRGFVTGDLGHATLVTNAVGFTALNMTAALTLTAGFRGTMTSGTGKYNLYMDGTAQNYLVGVTGIGVAASATSALTLAGSVAGVASLRIPHGTPPSSPVNGDIWTTTAGLFVQVNGVSVGPLS